MFEVDGMWIYGCGCCGCVCGVCVGCVGWNVCMSEELEVRIRIESQGLDKVWGYRARFRFRIKA